ARAQPLFAEQHRLVPVRYFLQHRAGAVELHPGLVNVVESHPLADLDRAFVERAFAEADAQQGGFADAVAANDTRALRWVQGESQPAKEPSLAVSFPNPGPRVR